MGSDPGARSTTGETVRYQFELLSRRMDCLPPLLPCSLPVWDGSGHGPCIISVSCSIVDNVVSSPNGTLGSFSTETGQLGHVESVVGDDLSLESLPRSHPSRVKLV